MSHTKYHTWMKIINCQPPLRATTLISAYLVFKWCNKVPDPSVVNFPQLLLLFVRLHVANSRGGHVLGCSFPPPLPQHTHTHPIRIFHSWPLIEFVYFNFNTYLIPQKTKSTNLLTDLTELYHGQRNCPSFLKLVLIWHKILCMTNRHWFDSYHFLACKFQTFKFTFHLLTSFELSGTKKSSITFKGGR